ncbi:MAG: exostosin family protein [Rhodospirillaceae bacterium]|nr:exostosin family protein [Rhodospirillaceae bacterium]
MRHTLLNPAPSDALKRALERFESGFYFEAGNQLSDILAKEPGNTDAAFYYRLIERKFAKKEPRKATLVWQFDPAQAWETDWLRLMLADSVAGEAFDNKWAHISDPMIVIDNRLVPEKISYYREAFNKGVRIILVHLSDETFRDDLGAYKYCDAVIRNYHSERLAAFSNIFTLPLGYKAGFTRGETPKPSSTRKYMWGFAGDSKKLTRAEMLAEMNKVPGGFTHLTSGFGAADALSTADYRALLDDSVFAPSPSGWSNIDSFRVYEALEAGCIPIVEQRPHFVYFTTLLGPHPIPTIENWADAVSLIHKLNGANETERVRLACANWWADYKPKLKTRLTDFISRAFENP